MTVPIVFLLGLLTACVCIVMLQRSHLRELEEELRKSASRSAGLLESAEDAHRAAKAAHEIADAILEESRASREAEAEAQDELARARDEVIVAARQTEAAEARAARLQSDRDQCRDMIDAFQQYLQADNVAREELRLRWS